MGGPVCTVLVLYSYVVFARVILSWFPLSPNSPIAGVYSFTYTLTEPILGPIRRVMPPLGGFDLSPLIVFFGIQILCRAA